MIIQSRKWRVIGRALVLLVSTVLILSYSGMASYALQDGEPVVLSAPADLVEENLAGRFVTLAGRPDLARSITLYRNHVTSLWLPLKGLDAALFVVTGDMTYERRGAAGETINFAGKIVPLAGAPNSSDAAELYLLKTGIEIPPESYVLLEGEEPHDFKPIVPLMGGLGLIWFISLVGFVRELRRSGR